MSYLPNKFQIGLLLKRKDRDLAALELQKGHIVGVYNRGVCALWFDGGNREVIEEVAKIKGEVREKKTIALTLSLDEFIQMIDLSKLPSNVKKLFSSPGLKHRLGSLCFIRAPLKKEYFASVPARAKSFNGDGWCMVQNWDSFGHSSVEKFLKRAKELGVVYPAVTSMNLTGHPEIVDQMEAEEFCRRSNIPIFLKDPQAHPRHKGSYTIITLDQNGVRLSRDGNIPGWIIERILGLSLIKDSTRASVFPQLQFPKRIFNSLSSKNLRKAVLLHLKGKDA